MSNASFKVEGGTFQKTLEYFSNLKKMPDRRLKQFAEEAIAALEEATPKRTGLTSRSWKYEIVKVDKGVRVAFINTNVQSGVNIALLIQNGHGTATGYWVEGRDYINPALKPVFERFKITIKEDLNGG